jgi:hypothetical protein
VLPAKVTGIVDATDLETTPQYAGYGHVTRARKIPDRPAGIGTRQEILATYRLAAHG